MSTTARLPIPRIRTTRPAVVQSDNLMISPRHHNPLLRTVVPCGRLTWEDRELIADWVRTLNNWADYLPRDVCADFYLNKKIDAVERYNNLVISLNRRVELRLNA